jgi:hypothetical protein
MTNCVDVICVDDLDILPDTLISSVSVMQVSDYPFSIGLETPRVAQWLF